MKKICGYKHDFKRVGEYSKSEKFGLMDFLISMYPKFRNLYQNNKYYSTVRPQKINVIRDGVEVVGTRKFL